MYGSIIIGCWSGVHLGMQFNLVPLVHAMQYYSVGRGTSASMQMPSQQVSVSSLVYISRL